MATDIVTLGQSKDLSQIDRMVCTLTAPSRTFADLQRSRSWWLPFLITVIISYLFSATAIQKVGINQLVTSSIAADRQSEARMENASPQQQAQIRRVAEIAFKASMVTAPLLILFFNLVMALVLMGSFNATLGGKAPFAGIFAVLMYANLIQNAKPLLAMIMLFAGSDPSTFNIQNPVGTNIGFFLGPDVAGGLKTLLTLIDAVTIWYVAVLAIGCAIVARLKRSEAIAVVFGWWIVIVIIRTAWSAVTG